MTSDILRRISWRDVFPWLILFRTFRIAISPSLLAVATLAVFLSPWGWRLADLIFQPLPHTERATWRERIPSDDTSLLFQNIPAAPLGYLPTARTALLDAHFYLAEPLWRCFQLQMTLRETAYYAFGMLWMLALWSFPGGMITRRAIVQLATESPTSMVGTASYAGRRYLSYFLTPLYPLCGIAALALPIAFLGLFVGYSLGYGSILAGLAWIFVALAGLGAMWLFGGLIFGWPLMWPTISAERDGDTFEAFSRSYSYVYGKPLHYFFYVVIAAAFGALSLAVVEVAASLVQEFGFWALSWGAGSANAQTLRAAALDFAALRPALSGQSSALHLGTTLIGLVVALIQSVAVAFRFTYFFAAASAIYLLLRQDVDEKEMDEIHLEGEQSQQAESAADVMRTDAARAAASSSP